jgi:hypothetical protein
MENFSSYFIFDRVVMAASVAIIEMLLFQVVYLVAFDPENAYLFAMIEKDAEKLEEKSDKNKMYIDAFIRANITLSIVFATLYAMSAIIVFFVDRYLHCEGAYHVIVNPFAYATFFAAFIVFFCIFFSVRKKIRRRNKNRKIPAESETPSQGE